MYPPSTALGWPKNVAHATAPHEALLARFAQSAAEVVAVSATGDELAADLVVTEGHKHDAIGTVIVWRQLGQWALDSQAIAGAQSTGIDVSGVTPRNLGTLPFRVPLGPGGLSAPYPVIYPRVRVTVPTPGGPATAKLMLAGDVVRLPGGAPVSIATLPALNIGSLAGPPVVSHTNKWFAFGPIELSEADLVLAAGRIALRLNARTELAPEVGTIFEVQIGLLGGL